MKNFKYRTFDPSDMYGLNGRNIQLSLIKCFDKQSLKIGDILKPANIKYESGMIQLHVRDNDNCVLITDNGNNYISSEDLQTIIFEKYENVN